MRLHYYCDDLDHLFDRNNSHVREAISQRANSVLLGGSHIVHDVSGGLHQLLHEGLLH